MAPSDVGGMPRARATSIAVDASSARQTGAASPTPTPSRPGATTEPPTGERDAEMVGAEGDADSTEQFGAAPWPARMLLGVTLCYVVYCGTMRCVVQ